MLTDLYPPFIGGIEQHVRNLGHGLVERGHEVAVATMGGRDLPAAEIDGGVRVHRMRGSAQRIEQLTSPQGRPHSPPFPDPEVTMALRRILLEERPAIVHAHNWLVRSFVPLKARSGARLVTTLHDYGLICAKRSYLYRDQPCSGPGAIKCLRCAADNYGAARGLVITLGNWLMGPSQRSAVDMYLPVSTAVADGNQLARQRLPFKILPNFVPDDVDARADETLPQLAELPDDGYWLYVGTLSRHKGLPVLLEAYAGLEGAPPLVLIGSRWRDTPSQLPPNVTVLHNLPHSAVMAAWKRSALGFVPSVFPDPCPTVAMEAMACGVPLIASRVGGLPDIVGDNETGLLVEHGNVEQLRAAMQRFLVEPELTARMRWAARSKVASFTASSVIDRLEDIYAGLTAEPLSPTK